MDKKDKTTFAILMGLAAVFMTFLWLLSFVLIDVSYASEKEFKRIIAEQDDIYAVKCRDPLKEYEAKKNLYADKYKTFSNAEVFEILDRDTTDDNKEQKAHAAQLKIERDMADEACKEASAEAEEVKRPGNWEYFGAHWKQMIFGIEG